MSNPYDDENLDRPEDITNGVDYIIECPECGEYRHKSWFEAHRRGCAACSFFGREYLNGLPPTSQLILPASYKRN